MNDIRNIYYQNIRQTHKEFDLAVGTDETWSKVEDILLTGTIYQMNNMLY